MRTASFAIATAALLATGIFLTARADEPGKPPLIADACGTVPAEMTCMPAVITSPRDTQEVDPSGGYSLKLTGVAPRGSKVFVYFLRADRSRINAKAYNVRANETGAFSLSLSLLPFANGKTEIAAYTLADLRERKANESFFQMTGTPTPSFTVRNSADVTLSPSTCRFGRAQRFDFPPELGLPGYLVKNNDRTFYWARPAEDTSTLTEQDTAAARGYIHDTTMGEFKKMVCQRALPTLGDGIKAKSTVGDFLDRLDPLIAEALETGGFKRLDNLSTFVTRDEMAARLRQALQDDACTEADFTERDGEWAPLSGDNIVLAWTLIEAKYRATESYECEGMVISWLSGESPMLFLTSDHDVRARVDVRAPGGRVSFADPALPAAVDVGPGRTPDPLYYEFASPVPALPAEGWTVEGDRVEGFLQELLVSWGYDADEARRFIAGDVYPRLPEAPYVTVRLFDRATVDALLPLDITPTPDRVERLLFHLTPTENPATFAAPTPQPHVATTGFTAREFGAVIAR